MSARYTVEPLPSDTGIPAAHRDVIRCEPTDPVNRMVIDQEATQTQRVVCYATIKHAEKLAKLLNNSYAKQQRRELSEGPGLDKVDAPIDG